MGARVRTNDDLDGRDLEGFNGAKEQGLLAGVAIGAVIALEAMFAGPISGASMNPARSFAPAVVAGNFAHLWIYLTAPIAGALAGVMIWRILRPTEINDLKSQPIPEAFLDHAA